MNDVATPHKPIQKWALICLIVYSFIGGMLALPDMSKEGILKGTYTMAMYAVVNLRLVYGLLKRNLCPLDFVGWCGAFLVFVAFVELY